MKFDSKKITFSLIIIFTIIKIGKSENITFNSKIGSIGKTFLKNLGKHFQDTNLFNTSECMKDIETWYNSFVFKRELWSMKMLDAWGKFPTGIFSINIDNLGHYDQCVSVKHLHIKGKYCLAKFPMELSRFEGLDQYENETLFFDGRNKKANIMINFKNNEVITYTNGICFPHTCNATEMLLFFQIVSNYTKLRANITIEDKECFTNDRPTFKNLDWIAVGISAFIILLMILSTLYDFVIRQYNIEKKGNVHELMISFSIWKNTSQITTISKGESSIKCLHGLRSLSLLWIILGHRYALAFMGPSINNIDIFYWYEKVGSIFVLAGTYAVDTFFVLSGLLVAYSSFKRLENYNWFDVPELYLHRYLRLTPALAAVVFLHITLIKFFGDGPLWVNFMNDFTIPCEKNWWTTLLYVQNYYNSEEMCIPQAWYLCCDFQLYLLTPLLIYPFLRSKKLGWVILISLILAAQTTTFVVAYINKWPAGIIPLGGVGNRGTDFYYVTHTKAAPWLMGFALGCMLHYKLNKKIKMNRILVWLLWIISFTIMGFLVLELIPLQKFDHVITHQEDTMYNAFSKTAWSAAIIWIVFACIYGYGGPINWFLSLEIWEILGKLSYSMFLIHVSMEYVIAGRTRHSVYFSDFSAITLFCSDLVMTIVCGYLLAISFELPFFSLEKILLRRK